MLDVVFKETAIIKKIDQIRVGAAAGPGQISARLLKETKNEIAKPLAILFKRSMETGIVPEQWKTANVSPIYKKGQKTTPLNYRPVSLTCIIGKIMEMIIKDAIVAFFRRHNIIRDSQHGFTKAKSTLTNLLEYIAQITERLDLGKPVDVLYADYSKAFDVVPHARLATQEFKYQC